MKVYNLSYQHIAGHTMEKQTTGVFELFQALEVAMGDQYVLDDTIVLSTEERAVEGLKQPETATPMSDEDIKLEREYQLFKGSKR